MTLKYFAIPFKATCEVCGDSRVNISRHLKVCCDCAKEGSAKAMKLIYEAHAKSRAKFGLPAAPPKDPNGLECRRCGNECQISEDEKGYCGLAENRDGNFVRLATPKIGIVRAYYDPHPTNCTAAWTCAGGSEHGYPTYSVSKGAEHGYYNLAVFYGSCTYDCLFCQNPQWRKMTQELKPIMSAEELASKVNERTTCICYFGGDPSSQIAHAIETAKIARERKKELNKQGRCEDILRICLETNGNMKESWLDEIAEISLASGGGIKFDLKAWNENLHVALSGASNKQSLENIRRIGKYHKERPEVPFIRASTLLVPGYVDTEEVKNIASYLAEIDPTIPYSLLAFMPQFEMSDLPPTSRKLAYKCKEMAEKAGLERVIIGNKWSLV
ncbi:MAG: radical SAM protein [Candidatus Aenigmarchaeota archaeon]|nr:radical SAM protein [Candidatus Aenigmarchaeota archaeon]